MNAKKMSTKEIVNKLHKMTDVPVDAIESMTREDLVIHLNDLMNGDTDAQDFYNAVMGLTVDNNEMPANVDEAHNDETELYLPGLTAEAIEAMQTTPVVTDEVLPEDCVAKADAPATNRAKFEDPKLRKAYRTKCRAIANKLNVAWQQTEAGDYVIDGKLYTFDDFVANHNK